MGSRDIGWRPVVSLTFWGVVAFNEWLHLVGVHLDGHTRLPPGHWIITSPVIALDLEQGLAITASTGRYYKLLERIHGAWPREALALIIDANDRWQVRRAVPSEPVAWNILPSEILKRGVAGSIDLHPVDPHSDSESGS